VHPLIQVGRPALSICQMASAKTSRRPERRNDVIGLATQAVGIASAATSIVGVPALGLVCESLQRLLNIVKVSHAFRHYTSVYICYQEVDQNNTRLVGLFDQTTEILQLIEDEISNDERAPEWALSPSFLQLCQDIHQYVCAIQAQMAS
jgi:hypothetical protein